MPKRVHLCCPAMTAVADRPAQSYAPLTASPSVLSAPRPLQAELVRTDCGPINSSHQPVTTLFSPWLNQSPSSKKSLPSSPWRSSNRGIRVLCAQHTWEMVSLNWILFHNRTRCAWRMSCDLSAVVQTSYTTANSPHIHSKKGYCPHWHADTAKLRTGIFTFNSRVLMKQDSLWRLMKESHNLEMRLVTLWKHWRVSDAKDHD